MRDAGAAASGAINALLATFKTRDALNKKKNAEIKKKISEINIYSKVQNEIRRRQELDKAKMESTTYLTRFNQEKENVDVIIFRINIEKTFKSLC